MPLSLERVITLLAESERGIPCPAELRDKRYVVLHGIDPEIMRDPPEEDDPFLEKAKPWIGMRTVGEASNFYDALRLLWQSIEELQNLFREEGEEKGEPGPFQPQLSKWLAEGPWGVPKDEVGAATEFGVSLVKQMYRKSRYEFAFYGDAPYEGESAAIIEVPPVVELSNKNKNLFAACRKNDLARVRELLAKGADVRAVDSFGDTPLHHAVAHRNRDMVLCLLDAGADPNASSRFGHAPVFANRGTRGHTAPTTDHFEDEAHFELIALLIERGADPTVRRPFGQTLLDAAAKTKPLNKRWVRYFLDRGVSSVLATVGPYNRRPLDLLLRSLHYNSPEARAQIPDRVRLLGWLGCDPNETTNSLGQLTPVEEWLTTGYSAKEVEPEVIVGIAQAFVDIGARDDRTSSDRRKPSERAMMWSEGEGKEHYAEAARILREGRRSTE